MNGNSVLFFCLDKTKLQKGKPKVHPYKKVALALSAGAALMLLSGQQTVAKGEMENISAPFAVVEEMQGSKNFQVIKMVVKAKPEQVYKLLTDYENATSVFPHLIKCHVIEDHGVTKIVEHKVQPSGPFGTFDYVLEVKETPSRSLEWHRIRGDFKEVDGYWRLEPMEGGRQTVVTYSSYVNGGFFIPQPLIKRQVRQDMPGVMAALKTQAETNSAQIAGRPQTLRHN